MLKVKGSEARDEQQYEVKQDEIQEKIKNMYSQSSYAFISKEVKSMQPTKGDFLKSMCGLNRGNEKAPVKVEPENNVSSKEQVANQKPSFFKSLFGLAEKSQDSTPAIPGPGAVN